MTFFILAILAILWAGIYWLARTMVHRAGSPRPGRLVAEIIAASGLLAAATIGFFWQIVFTGNSWMPAGGGDLAPFLYPYYHFAAEHLRQGVIPLWNPHLYSGSPFAADIQTGLFYPVNLPVFLLAPGLDYRWLQYLAIFHFWLAATTMYMLLRLQPPAIDQHPNASLPRPAVLISPVAAFAGAITFGFSDLFIVHFGNLNMIAVAAWLPLVFLLFQHALYRRSLGLAATAGTVLAIATLAGHIQITLFILLTLGLYTLWIVAVAIHRQWQSLPGLNFHHLRVALPPFYALAVALLVTIGLSALLLLPAYEMSQYTPRAQLTYPEAARYSLHPAQLAGMLVPDYFGRDPALHWGPWDRVETGYIGILPLLLAGIGMLCYPDQRRKLFYIGLVAVALILAMGGYSLPHGWLYALVPGFGQLRAPARFILLADFALAFLAAGGLNVLLHQPWQPGTRRRLGTFIATVTWIIGGLIIIAAPLSYFAMLITQDRNPVIFDRAVGAASGMAMFALFGIIAVVILRLIYHHWLNPPWAGLVVVVVIGLDLFTMGYNVDVGHTNPTTGFDHPEAIAFLQNDPDPFRIEVTTDIWHLWQPNSAMVHGLYDVWGLYNPLTLADTTLYWSGAPPRNTGRYNFLGPKYIIASKAGAPADGNIVPIFDADPDINIYLNQDALARVLFVGQNQVVSSHDQAWEAIRADTFDPTVLVVLEGEAPSLNNQPTATLALLQYNTDQVTVGVTTDQAGYLLLSDAYYPGWQATVDGQPTPIYRANYAFRAVFVPAGEHTINFVFRPVLWTVGLLISAITLILLAGYGLWLTLKR
jgi:hypothetical protein